MRLKLVCPNEQYTFSSEVKARQFLFHHGIADNFLTNSIFVDSTGPVILYGSPNFTNLTAFVISFPLSHEIGLWVQPDFRRKGIGSSLFETIINNITNSNLNYRLFARVDLIDSIETKAMCKILIQSKFKKIPVNNASCLSLWFR